MVGVTASPRYHLKRAMLRPMLGERPLTGRAIRVGAVLALAASLAAGCAQTSGVASGGAVAAPDPANATFRLEKESITLVNGRNERPAAPGSASAAVTTLGDQRANGDVDGDGRPDAIVILVNQPGGSGTFSYVAALLNPSTGVSVTPAVLLGDRIVVSGVRIDGRTIVVDLQDRAPGQPLTASPSLAVTKRFVIDAGSLKVQ
jgi:hypothetical protein